MPGGGAKKVVVVGAYKMSAILDYTDRATCVLFGDGAGAVLLEPSDNGHGIRNGTWQQSQGGLANVRARVQSLVGDMSVDSDRSGTRIAIRLPSVDGRPLPAAAAT